MKSRDRALIEAKFYPSLAVELDSHLAGGSEFVFQDGDDATAANALRCVLLGREVERLQKMAMRARSRART